MVDIHRIYKRGSFQYHALKGVSLNVEQGEMVAIMGQSGAGKSTLMHIIGLLDTPTSGEYYLDGQEVSTFSDDERSHIRNQKIGFVFQGFFLLSRLSALDNVLLPTVYEMGNLTNPKEYAMHLLERVGMSKFAAHKPHELSGGQQQRIAIARALMCKPSVVLADEPTGALDSEMSEEILRLFTDLNQKDHVTVVVITHSQDVGERCQRIIRIKDGLVEE